MSRHREVVHLIEQHYHINGTRCVDQLSSRNKVQLAIAILKDFDYFDPAELILYNPIKNISLLMEEYFNQKISSNTVLHELCELIINDTRNEVNELFDEIIERNETKNFDTPPLYGGDKIDAIVGFI